MPYARLGELQMYYEVEGAGDPLLLVHGAAGAIDRPQSGWAALLPEFAQHFRCLSVEYRGHGRTNNPDDSLSYPLIADDLCAFIRALDLGPVNLAGVSDGAIVALHIGMTQPEMARALICVGANYYNDGPSREANAFFDAARIERDNPSLAADYAQAHDRNKEPGYWRYLIRHIADNLAENPAYSLDDLAQIPQPTLLIAGENDLWANPDQMLAMRHSIPHSEMLIINHAGHTVQHTHPHIVGPVVLDFLARNL